MTVDKILRVSAKPLPEDAIEATTLSSESRSERFFRERK